MWPFDRDWYRRQEKSARVLLSRMNDLGFPKVYPEAVTYQEAFDRLIEENETYQETIEALLDIIDEQSKLIKHMTETLERI